MTNNILVRVKYLPTLPNKGVWNIEPDILLWEYNNVNCLIVRNKNSYTLNGYVQTELSEETLYVPHGGFTYIGNLPTLNEEVLSYIDKESRWVGFDTGHCDDYYPAIPFMEGKYRTIKYVKKEVELLAESIKQ